MVLPPLGARPARGLEGRDEILRAELAMVDELLELEPDAKWPLATAAFLGRALGDRPADVESRLVELKRVDPVARGTTRPV